MKIHLDTVVRQITERKHQHVKKSVITQITTLHSELIFIKVDNIILFYNYVYYII